MNDEPKQEKKIIVDEDWKSQIESEKESLKQSKKAEEPKSNEAASDKAESYTLPEPSLMLLATTLATQAMVAMGLVPMPGSEKQEISLPEAKHFIDTIGMLQSKTEGNRTAEETTTLENMLHELRMVFLAVQEQSTASDSPSAES